MAYKLFFLKIFFKLVTNILKLEELTLNGGFWLLCGGKTKQNEKKPNLSGHTGSAFPMWKNETVLYVLEVLPSLALYNQAKSLVISF